MQATIGLATPGQFFLADRLIQIRITGGHGTRAAAATGLHHRLEEL